jgi:transcriptional regulator with XRE-family HTH domain
LKTISHAVILSSSSQKKFTAAGNRHDSSVRRRPQHPRCGCGVALAQALGDDGRPAKCDAQPPMAGRVSHRGSNVTESFGARLRRERERQRISLKSIAATTNIRSSLFEQLERGDVSKWPAGIFRRAFVRAYADAIGLDPESTVRDFLQAFPDPAHAAANANAHKASAPPARASIELRLQLATGRVAPQRLLTVCCDVVVLAAIALASAVIVGQVWMPLALAMGAYYFGGTILTGGTPGAFFLGWYRRLGQPTAKPAASPSAAPFLVHPDRGHVLSLDLSESAVNQ